MIQSKAARVQGAQNRRAHRPPTPAASRSAASHQLLEWQQTVGNRIVTAWLQRNASSRVGADGRPLPVVLGAKRASAELLRPTRPVVQRDPAPPTSAEFTAEYNKYAGGYAFLAQRQVLAIDSVYTEAKKPEKPDLAEDLLVALATAALGSVISLIGSSIGAAVERKIAARLATPSMSENQVLKASAERAQEGAKILGRAVNDAFKDGAKSLTSPRVRELLESGKTPIDAFYEGQKDSVVLAAKAAHDKAEEFRSTAEALGALSPVLPTIVARSLAEGLQEEFAHAYQTQQRVTLVHWLSYQGQQRINRGKQSIGPDGSPGTILHNMVERGDLQHRIDRVPGVLFVDAYAGPITDAEWTVWPIRGHLAGLTEAMISTLSGPIGSLRLPVIYRVSSLYREGGRGRSDLPQSMWPGPYAFNIGVNENGEMWESSRYKWQRLAVEKIGGVRKIVDLLNLFSLKGLKVEATRG